MCAGRVGQILQRIQYINEILEAAIQDFELDTLVLGMEAIGYDHVLLHVCSSRDPAACASISRLLRIDPAVSCFVMQVDPYRAYWCAAEIPVLCRAGNDRWSQQASEAEDDDRNLWGGAGGCPEQYVPAVRNNKGIKRMAAMFWIALYCSVCPRISLHLAPCESACNVACVVCCLEGVKSRCEDWARSCCPTLLSPKTSIISKIYNSN